jgi:hypothetical protein
MNVEQVSSLMSESHVSNFKTFDSNVPDLTLKLRQLTEGVFLWKYCIILVLFFLLAETLLLRLWKT